MPEDSSQAATPSQFHQEAKRIFVEVLEKRPERRAECLADLCAGNSELYREVHSLLESYETDTGFLDQPPAAGVDPMIDRQLGPYKILRRVGMGGMGAVYLAERADEQFRKRVALKAVRPGLIDDQLLRRFQNERQTLAVLDHPNIIKLLDAGTTTDGVPYLVMEYVEGQPIDEYCDSRKLSVRERLGLFRVVLSAVHYAHQNLVVHRDLKPGNILVAPDGAPKLLDFGIAKLLRPEYAAHMGLTRTALQPMTPEFASPEQVRGQPITTASDIYSLGVILYRLLTGRHPYELKTSTALELERAICETEPEKPSKLAAGAEAGAVTDRRALRGDLDTIVLMAMRKEPQRRYASAEHFSEDLRRYLEGRPVLARKAGPWYRASKFVGRHRVSCAMAALLSAGIVVSGAAAIEEKKAAERRFDDLRKFANFGLNEMDDKLRDGPTAARKAWTGRSLEYLDELAREKRSPDILRDLVNGYFKNGDVLGNLYGANLGETAQAEAAYRKALKFAEELARSPSATAEDRRNLVLANKKLGELLAGTGNRVEALQHYEAALRENQPMAAAHNPDALKDRFYLWADVGSARELMSDPEEALAVFRHQLDDAEMLPADKGRSTAVAYAQERIAYWSAIMGNPAGAEATILESIAAYQRSVDKDPKPDRVRNLAKAYKTLAEVRKRQGKYGDALDAIRQSEGMTAKLLAGDPKSEQSLIDRQQAIMLEISILSDAGAVQESHAQTKRALELMRPLAERPDGPYQHAADYAELLLITPFPELRNPSAALRYALKANALCHEMDADLWRVVSLAYERNGDLSKAREAAQKALALLPPVRPGKQPTELRQTLDARLARLSKMAP